MHVGISYLRWRGKGSRHSRRMRTRDFAYLARGPLRQIRNNQTSHRWTLPYWNPWIELGVSANCQNHRKSPFLTPYPCSLANDFENKLTRKCITTKMCQIWEQSILSFFSYRSHGICTASGGRLWYESLISPIPSFPFTTGNMMSIVYSCIFKSLVWLLMNIVIYTRPLHLEFAWIFDTPFASYTVYMHILFICR